MQAIGQFGEDRREAGDRAAEIEPEGGHADDEQCPFQGGSCLPGRHDGHERTTIATETGTYTSPNVSRGFTAALLPGRMAAGQGGRVPTRLVHIAIDAADPERLAGFWARVFGWQTQAGADGEVMVLPGGWRYPDPGPLPLLFVPAREPKTSKNRVHIDVPTKSRAFFEDEVKRITGLGATPADIGQGDVPWEVLADPEGNELCVLDPRPGVYFDTGPLAAVVVGCADPAAVAGFWALASGFRRSQSRSTPDAAVMRAPVVRGPFLELIRDPGAAASGSRARLDVAPPADGDLDAAVTELLAAGARPADGGQADAPWITLSDPDGLEFRVLTPR